MPGAIDQSMWSFQPRFRTSFESAAQESLGSIGLSAAPTGLLIGFQERPGGHAICVEPENRGASPELFAGCMEAGQAAYDTHEHRGMLHTHAGVSADYHADLLDKCRAQAVADVLNGDDDHDLHRWFVGSSALVGRYRVFPAVGVLRSRWDELPTLTRRDHDHRSEMCLSFQESVVRELLQSTSFALNISDEPHGLRSDDTAELAGRALKSFVRQLVFFKGDFMGGDLDTSMNRVAAQPYEGRTGVGTMLLASNEDVVLELAFDNPIGLTQTRALRKALEMTDSRLRLVTDGNVASGLGALADDYPPDRESAFLLRVIGRGAWELEHAGVPLLVVTDGHAEIPRPRIVQPAFDDAVERLFGSDGDPKRLWSLALAASEQAHGTMLVVHADAQHEALRLSPPAMRVHPGPLTEETLLAVSAIDGAIVVDPAGMCHAVGAILDGLAVPGLGDASRGARYNSARRYLEGASNRCLIIIVSEDGMINLIPDLPRRIKRSYVEAVLSDYETLSVADSIDFETFHKRDDHLRSLQFYLTAQQCVRANAARERAEEARAASIDASGGLGGITRVGYSPLEPDPRLDDSYFLAEDD